ncbi:hypothetical protein NP233_g8435 [Leucocoprinus birnbaumii]|uniref:Uncharacterized protein n=1 Tax=Leucocoprinus birnbaumii TaxID=56174 RepID=A0AAD5VMB0_9AGAR|nr:hypothetical protein NP233_g8435 [Leucocoprinus birnbaumii]
MITEIDSDDEEMVDFLGDYQKDFNANHAKCLSNKGSEKKKKKGDSQITWVRKNVMSKFIAKFGPCSDDMTKRVDRYLRNRSPFTRRASSRNVSNPTPPDQKTTSVKWLQVMTREPEKKGEVEEMMWEAIHDEGVASKGDYVRYYNEALHQVADNLSKEDAAVYKSQADLETQLRKEPPTPEDVYLRQEALSAVISDCIAEKIGWKAGQAGDVVVMVVSGYRNADQLVQTDIAFTSNSHIPSSEVGVTATTQAFREHVQQLFKDSHYMMSFVGRDKTVPCFSIDYDDLSPKQLRDKLFKEICKDWKRSGNRLESRLVEALPWSELSTEQGRTRLLSRAEDFAVLGFNNPLTVQSVDWLNGFAKVLNAHGTTSLFLSADAPTSCNDSMVHIPAPPTPPSSSPVTTHNDKASPHQPSISPSNHILPTLAPAVPGVEAIALLSHSSPTSSAMLSTSSNQDAPSPLQLPLHDFHSRSVTSQPPLTSSNSVTVSDTDHRSTNISFPPTSATPVAIPNTAEPTYYSQASARPVNHQVQSSGHIPAVLMAPPPPVPYSLPLCSAVSAPVPGPYLMTRGITATQVSPATGYVSNQRGGGDVVRAGLTFASTADDVTTTKGADDGASKVRTGQKRKRNSLEGLSSVDTTAGRTLRPRNSGGSVEQAPKPTSHSAAQPRNTKPTSHKPTSQAKPVSKKAKRSRK